MRQLIYHIATTLDGFIAHPDGSTTGMLESGEHADDYLMSLKDYDTVLMGRKTYEAGYPYGLKPGEPAYPHMMHYIFSKSLCFDQKHEQVEVIAANDVEFVTDLKQSVGSPIYLCGGGALAGHLLHHRLIDQLMIKLNPVCFGEGIRLFHNCSNLHTLKPVKQIAYENGVHLLHYELNY